MKINRLETHDRLSHFKEDQSANVFKGAEECLKSNEDSLFYQDHSPYVYLYAHPRTEENGDKCLYWQPRLTRPIPSENSYLFRAQSKTDTIEVCWIIPPKPLWPEFEKGKLMENELITWSVDQFTNHPLKLAAPESDDLPEEKAKKILKQLIAFKRNKKKNKPKIIADARPKILEGSPFF